MAEGFRQESTTRLYSDQEGEYPPHATTKNSHQTLHPTIQNGSTSSLSEAMDPDADAEGEPDDLDADADGIEDDDGVEYEDEIEEQDDADCSFERLPNRSEQDRESGEDDEQLQREGLREDTGEEMDLDENASSPPPSPPSRLLEQANYHEPESTKKPLVLKLKLANQPLGPHSAPPARAPKRKHSRKPPVAKSTSNRSRLAHDKKVTSSSQRQNTDEEDDELSEDWLGSNSGMDDEQAMGNQSGVYQVSEDSNGASTGEDTMPGVGQLTVRQRAKECGEPVTELQSLPMTEGKKKKEVTEADRAMEKAEKSRKRKHQNEKKLEDEKTETINRLLKGQAGKAGRNTGSKAPVGIDTTTEENNSNQQSKKQQLVPTLIRSISTIRSGEYITSLNLPSPILQHSNLNLFLTNQSIHPPPPVRPPPKSWKLVNGVRLN